MYVVFYVAHKRTGTCQCLPEMEPLPMDLGTINYLYSIAKRESLCSTNWGPFSSALRSIRSDKTHMTTCQSWQGREVRGWSCHILRWGEPDERRRWTPITVATVPTARSDGLLVVKLDKIVSPESWNDEFPSVYSFRRKRQGQVHVQYQKSMLCAMHYFLRGQHEMNR